MFTQTKAFSGFAVDDIAAAKAFYGETLGIETSEESGLLTLHLAGDRPTLVYPKPDHVPATYTVLNFVGTAGSLTARVQGCAGGWRRRRRVRVFRDEARSRASPPIRTASSR